MKYYSQFGFHEFVICLGYKQYVVKEFFADYFLHTSDVTFDLANNKMEVHNNYSEPWKVTLVDTGLHTMTGGRIKRIRDYVGGETFHADLRRRGGGSWISHALLAFHKKHGKIATITAVNVGQKFGVLDVDGDNNINAFREKNDDDGSLINGGFMVMEPGVFDYIEGDATVFEKKPLEDLARDGQLMAYKHNGFWKCMDTQRRSRVAACAGRSWKTEGENGTPGKCGERT